MRKRRRYARQVELKIFGALYLRSSWGNAVELIKAIARVSRHVHSDARFTPRINFSHLVGWKNRGPIS